MFEYSSEQKRKMLLDIVNRKTKNGDLPYDEVAVVLVKHTPGGVLPKNQVVNVYTPDMFKKYKWFGVKKLSSNFKVCTCSYCIIHTNETS